jgi:phosphonatase-like hydrolase
MDGTTTKNKMEFRMNKLDLVVFDMAGTTIQVTDQVPAAFQQAFQQVGVTLSDEEIRSVRGRSKREAIAYLLNRHLSLVDRQRHATAVYSDFQRILMERFEGQGIEPVDGAEETFEWLRTRDVKVVLSTGFDRAVAALLLRNVGWDKSLDAVVCNEDVLRGRPAPYMVFRAMEWTGCECVHRVAAVGDTVSDLQAADNAGVRWCIGVLSGAHSKIQLESCPHSEIICSVKELPSIFND